MNAVTDLLDQLARDIPSLPDAACRGTNVMDVPTARDREAVRRAQAVCATCPALARCEEWLASLPPHRRPWGVVAGRFVRPPWLRPLPDPKPRPETKRDTAARWLVAYLSAGPVLSTQVRADAVAAGIDIDNLARARRHLGVQLERTTGARGGQRWWTLPYNPNNGRHHTMTDTLDTLGTPRSIDLIRALEATLRWDETDFRSAAVVFTEAKDDNGLALFCAGLLYLLTAHPGTTAIRNADGTLDHSRIKALIAALAGEDE